MSNRSSSHHSQQKPIPHTIYKNEWVDHQFCDNRVYIWLYSFFSDSGIYQLLANVDLKILWHGGAHCYHWNNCFGLFPQLFKKQLRVLICWFINYQNYFSSFWKLGSSWSKQGHHMVLACSTKALPCLCPHTTQRKGHVSGGIIQNYWKEVATADWILGNQVTEICSEFHSGRQANNVQASIDNPKCNRTALAFDGQDSPVCLWAVGLGQNLPEWG